MIYHGTGTTFDSFLVPAYFTDDKNTALFFANQHERFGIPTLMTCDFSFKNPMFVDLEGQSWGGFFLGNEALQDAAVNYAAGGNAEELEYFKEEGLTIPFLASYAETSGYDGVIAYNCMEENGVCSTQVVALNPENIRIIRTERASDL